MKYDVDMLNDKDVQREGVTPLDQYRVILTGHHSKYVSA
jgi:hypothetical protein